jgi:hypothetical protein
VQLSAAGDFRCESQAFVVPGEVGRDGLHVAETRQRRPRFFACVGLAGADYHAGAGLQEPAGNHQPDTSGPAGDQGALTGQVE